MCICVVYWDADKGKAFFAGLLFVSRGVRGKPRMYLSLDGFLYRPL
jgi:hypothetical protein